MSKMDMPTFMFASQRGSVTDRLRYARLKVSVVDRTNASTKATPHCRDNLTRLPLRPRRLRICQGQHPLFHRFQRNLLREQGVPRNELAFRHETPLRDGVAVPVKPTDVHRRPGHDAIPPTCIAAHHFEVA